MSTRAASAPSPRARIYDSLLRLCLTDFTRTRPFVALSALFFLVRLPFINYGHGTDPDAWRVAMTAHHLLATGDYFPSRLPGNPLHELVMTLFIPGGWIATNLATAAISLAGVYVFALIVRDLKLPNAGLLVTGFAFTPLLLINSIATMDYMWTLTAILGCYYLLLKGRPVPSGLLLGVAIGFRLQSFILWPPMVYMLWRQGRVKDVPVFSLASGGAAMLAFAPVLAVYGVHFWNYYDASVGYEDVLRLLGKEALGVLGGLGVIAGAVLSWRQLKRLLPDLKDDVQLGVWVAVIVVYFGTFSRLPHEVAYLIPVFPFGFLILGRYYSRAALVTAIAAILLAGVVDVTTPGSGIGPAELRSATVGKGLVLSNAETMSDQRKFVQQIVNNDLPDHAVVLTGFIFPQLAVRERDRLDLKIIERDYGAISMLSDRGEGIDSVHDIRYVWLLTYDAFDVLRAQGYSFFLAPDAGGGSYALYKYHPTLFGATLLTLDRKGPSVGKGTAGTDR